MAEEKTEITSAKSQNEINNHLLILYLYQLLLTESDQDHMLSTTQIRQKMQEYSIIVLIRDRSTLPLCGGICCGSTALERNTGI